MDGRYTGRFLVGMVLRSWLALVEVIWLLTKLLVGCLLMQ